MCKAATTCTELGNDASQWSRLAPLMPPIWFQDEFLKFRHAVELAADGNVEGSRQRLKDVRGDDLNSWYVIHGQNSGGFRHRHYRLSPTIAGACSRGAPPVTLLVATYRRDYYRCRYCGLRLFPVEVLRWYENAVGSQSFKATAKNASHGAALTFRCTYDHVNPMNRGGQHSFDNLVTACYSCNFGKAGYTIEQLGIDDPRLRPPVQDKWDGLVSRISHFRRDG